MGGMPFRIRSPVAVRYPSLAMNELLVQRPIDAWAATIRKQNG